MLESPKPVVAAVQGHALGGGFETALGADMRIAADDAVFGFPEIGYGLTADTGGTQLLTPLVGPARAKYLLMTGDRIGAEQALAWGIVEWVVSAADLRDAVLVLAVQAGCGTADRGRCSPSSSSTRRGPAASATGCARRSSPRPCCSPRRTTSGSGRRVVALPEPPPVGGAMLPPGTFTGAVVLVTGGGTGLGKAIGVEFARLGATVAIVSRAAEHGAAGVAAMEAVGGRAVAAAADVRDPESVARAVRRGRGGGRTGLRAREQRGGELHRAAPRR